MEGSAASVTLISLNIGKNIVKKLWLARRRTICERAREERSNLGNYTTRGGQCGRSPKALSYEHLGSRADLIEANMEFAHKKAWDLHKN